MINLFGLWKRKIEFFFVRKKMCSGFSAVFIYCTSGVKATRSSGRDTITVIMTNTTKCMSWVLIIVCDSCFSFRATSSASSVNRLSGRLVWRSRPPLRCRRPRRPLHIKTWAQLIYPVNLNPVFKSIYRWFFYPENFFYQFQNQATPHFKCFVSCNICW